jgi:hypothetical protein
MSIAANIEYVDRLDANEARALTDQIKTGVEALWHLITRAYTERAWAALGYTSWDDYCTREFGTSRLRLPREERAEVVSSLRESGLSLRAIAAATGDSVTTVRRELAGVPNGTPERRTTTVTHGGGFVAPNEEIPCGTETLIDVDTGEELAECIHCHRVLPLSQLYEGGVGYECDPCVSPGDPEDVAGQELPPSPENHVGTEPESEPQPVAAAKSVVGIDGKTYPSKPRPQQQDTQRRRPLVDTARDLGLDVEKFAKRIEQFGADDRLVRNRKEVAPRLRHHLEFAIKVCQDLNQQLTQGV